MAASFTGSSSGFQLIRTGWVNLSDAPRSNLQRVAWQASDDGLQRSGSESARVTAFDLKRANRDLKKPLRSWSTEEEEQLCRYYSKEIHEAAFVLPTFARKALQ